MSDLNTSLKYIRELEELSERESIVHSLNPLSKMIVTIMFLFAVASVDKYDVSMLIGFIFYPIILVELSDIPKKILFKRVIITLPFCVVMGISNLIFDKGILFYIGGIPITYGILSCSTIIIKVVLTVTSVYILVATTSMEDIFSSLRKMKIPKIILVQLLLSYRYISVILKETNSMYTAYSLRSGNGKGINLEHMGVFLGQILLKSFARSEEIYMAMKCRGFDGCYPVIYEKKFQLKDYAYICILCISFVYIRMINISVYIFSLLN